MDLAVTIRPANPDDAFAIARVHVQSWRETYRGLVDDGVLDDPGLLAKRERLWTHVLTNADFASNRVAVAECGGDIVGIAMSGFPTHHSTTCDVQLHVLYVMAACYGSGAGLALLNAVVALDERVCLWVADPNPRAQAFYRKHGFRPDGLFKVDDGLREIRMTRQPQTK